MSILLALLNICVCRDADIIGGQSTFATVQRIVFKKKSKEDPKSLCDYKTKESILGNVWKFLGKRTMKKKNFQVLSFRTVKLYYFIFEILSIFKAIMLSNYRGFIYWVNFLMLWNFPNSW